ncbi:MAG TPA: YdcF family protein [Candidatus Limnocylindria bacterium]|nr:YdcF family protein [Candidatus Limnocylindria bacterium]
MRRFLAGVLVGILLMIAGGVTAFLLIGSWLAVEDPLAKVDAIVAISGDTGARADTAIALWKQGYAPLIVFSGAALDPESVSSAELMRREAVRQGVPEAATIIEPSSTTTEENATEVAKLMTQRHLRSAILVTSPYHQRRAAVEFGRAFEPSGLVFRNYPARDPEWNALLWWRREPLRSRTLLELVKLGAVFLSERK